MMIEAYKIEQILILVRILPNTIKSDNRLSRLKAFELYFELGMRGLSDLLSTLNKILRVSFAPLGHALYSANHSSLSSQNLYKFSRPNSMN